MAKTRETLAEILEKTKRYCATQERSHQDIRNKLLRQNVFGDDLEQIMAQLIEEDFLNESRFAKAFARGKFNQNKWGTQKIRQHLREKGVSEYNIKSALDEIDQEHYLKTLDDLLAKRFSTTLKIDLSEQKKTTEYLMRKGYDYSLVRERIRRYLDNSDLA